MVDIYKNINSFIYNISIDFNKKLKETETKKPFIYKILLNNDNNNNNNIIQEDTSQMWYFRNNIDPLILSEYLNISSSIMNYSTIIDYNTLNNTLFNIYSIIIRITIPFGKEVGIYLLMNMSNNSDFKLLYILNNNNSYNAPIINNINDEYFDISLDKFIDNSFLGFCIIFRKADILSLNSSHYFTKLAIKEIL